MIKGETIASGASASCPDCGVKLTLGVYRSAAGHYVGTYCSCGPYSRESGYYPSEERARDALKSGNFGRMPGMNPLTPSEWLTR